jgi:ArsR family transcriptional regulator
MLEGEEISRLLDILGNRNRRRIIQLLRQKPCFVTEISERLTISPKAVIEHLQLMERERILSSQNDERRRKYYYLTRDFNLMVTVQQHQVTPVQESGDLRSRYINSLSMLKRMISAQEKLITNLEYLERDIDQKINEIMKCGKQLLQSEAELNLIITLATYDLTFNDLVEITGLPPDELAGMIRKLMESGIVEKMGNYYRIRDSHVN